MNNVQNYLFLSYLQNIFAQIDAFCAFFEWSVLLFNWSEMQIRAVSVVEERFFYRRQASLHRSEWRHLINGKWNVTKCKITTYFVKFCYL